MASKEAPVTYTPDEQARIDAITQAWEKQIDQSRQKDPQLAEAEKQEIFNAINRISPGSVVDGVVQPCKKPPRNLRCVNPSQPAGFGQALQDAVKRDAADAFPDPKPKIKVDLDQLTQWEANYSGAYVPWGPKIISVPENIGTGQQKKIVNILEPSLQQDSKGNLLGWKAGKYFNSSGVTVGAGYDLGQHNAQDIQNSIDYAAKATGLLSESQAEALVNKLKPYAGKRRLDACQALQANPLSLTQAETDTVNYAILTNSLETAVRRYEALTGKDWADLSEQEQTVIMSQVHQTGGLDKTLAKDIASGNQQKVLKDLTGSREYDYMQAYYKEQDSNGTTQSHN